MGGVVKAVSSIVSGVASAVSSAVSATGSFVGSAGSTMNNCAQQTVKNVGSSVSNVIKNPLPVIETVALTSIGVPAPVAAATVSAANGGNVKQIATAAVTAYAGQQVAQTVGPSVAGATDSKALGSIAASASGASTQATLTGLAQGKGLQESLTMGLQAGAAAGITQGALDYISPKTGPAPVEERSTGIPAETYGDTGLPTSQEFPEGMSAAAQLAKTPQYYAELPTERKLLQSALYPAVYTTLFGQTTQPSTIARAPTSAPAPAPQQQAAPTQTTIQPGSQALAQALRVGDVGAPIFGGDKEEGRKSGWNIESLRYTGNVGEA